MDRRWGEDSSGLSHAQYYAGNTSIGSERGAFGKRCVAALVPIAPNSRTHFLGPENSEPLQKAELRRK